MNLKEATERLDKCICGMGVIEHYGFYTTFMSDLQIAEMFGADPIKDTYRRAFKEWKKDIIYMTELYIVLSWRGDLHWEKGGKEYAKIYYDLRKELGNYILKHFKGEELRYFIRFTD